MEYLPSKNDVLVYVVKLFPLTKNPVPPKSASPNSISGISN